MKDIVDIAFEFLKLLGLRTIFEGSIMAVISGRLPGHIKMH